MITPGLTYSTRGGRSSVVIHAIYLDYADRLVAVGSEFRKGAFHGASEWDAKTGFFSESGVRSSLDLVAPITTRPTPRPQMRDQNEYPYSHHETLKAFGGDNV